MLSQKCARMAAALLSICHQSVDVGFVPILFSHLTGIFPNALSVLVLGGNPSLLYPTTKGAIVQMTRAMAAQHGPENIRVNCVCPGMVFTPMVRGRGMTYDMRQARINQNLLKQEGTGWDVGYGKFNSAILYKNSSADGKRFSYSIPGQQGSKMDHRIDYAC